MCLRTRLSGGCKWSLQWCSGGGWKWRSCRKMLDKSSLLLWVKVFSGNMYLYTHSWLFLTHSLSSGSLSCQSHPPCLWKRYSKWMPRPQAMGHSQLEQACLVCWLSQNTGLLWGGRAMWFNLKLKPGTSACAERIQFGVFVFIFQCLACLLQKFNPMSLCPPPRDISKHLQSSSLPLWIHAYLIASK